MSQFYLLGYFVLCVIVITLINSYVLKKKKGSIASDNGKAATTEKNVVVKAVNSETDADPNQKPMKIGKILFVLLFGMFIAILNQTVINVLLPLIMGDLNTSTTTAQWLITGFMLVNGMLIPISAFLIERYGFRKLFITAMISFTIGSLICALATSFPVMMFGRVIQAIGAGILMPLGMNVFMTAFPPEKRGTAMGTMGIAMILAPAIGPTLSGWIVESYHWNVMFYGMFFLGIINLLFATAWFHPKKELSNPAFDFFGILFSSVGFGGLLYGFSEAGSKHWESPEVIIGLSLGVIFLFLFVWRQLTVEKPLLELRVLKYDIYTLTIIINSIVTMALFGAMLLLPIYLQNIRGFTPLQSGLLLLPGALIMGLMGPIAGKLFDKYGIRVLAIVGLVITSYATYEFTKLTGETPYSHILGIYILRSFGMSLIMMPIMTAGMNQLPQHLISHGTALSNTIRQVAGSIGTAILVTIMTQQTTEHLSNYTNTLTTNNDFFSSQLSQLGNSGIMSLYAKVIKTSTIDGINDAFLFATLLGLVALLLSFFLRTPKINREK